MVRLWSPALFEKSLEEEANCHKTAYTNGRADLCVVVLMMSQIISEKF